MLSPGVEPSGRTAVDLTGIYLIFLLPALITRSPRSVCPSQYDIQGGSKFNQRGTQRTTTTDDDRQNRLADAERQGPLSAPLLESVGFNYRSRAGDRHNHPRAFDDNHSSLGVNQRW